MSQRRDSKSVLSAALDQNTNRLKYQQTLVSDKNNTLVIYGYRRNSFKSWLTYFFYIMTLGSLRLVYYWFPVLLLKATYSQCPLDLAEKILIKDKYHSYESYFVETVHTLSVDDVKKKAGDELNVNSDGKLPVYLGNGYFKEFSSMRAIWCKKLCYVWDEEKNCFVKLVGLEKSRRCNEFYLLKSLSMEDRYLRYAMYGKNEINVPEDTVIKLLIMEALTPFYVFQIFSLLVWLSENYYSYLVAIVIMSIVGISSSIIQTRKNQSSLKKTIHTAEDVRVFQKDGTIEKIASCKLVPGDIIEIPREGCILQCDAVLIKGNCVVNESMLTGESVPVIKNSLPKTDDVYNDKEHSLHTLYCGTRVIQTRSEGNGTNVAVVIRTGYLTSKGNLVRSILFPSPSDFKFDQDSYKFIGILAVIALLGCLYTIISKSNRGLTPLDILIKTLDIITIVIPPALPAVMTLGKLYALARLKTNQIFCINSRVINVSGSIDCVCFDKTGTLTENDLDMWGVVPTTDDHILQLPVRDIAQLNKNSALLKGMATCHSLTMIEDNICGDPIDMKMFESTGWLLSEEESSSSGLSYFAKLPQALRIRRVSSVSGDIFKEGSRYTELQIEIVKQFQFMSNLQRMSVIVKDKNSESYQVFCKGSPEMIASLSNPETVPNDIEDRLKEFTVKGYRVIALGVKTVEFQDFDSIDRKKIESDLRFIGFIVLENRIKSVTPGVIKILKAAGVKIVMITGDNIQTALSVAKESGIIGNEEIITEITLKKMENGSPSVHYKDLPETKINGKLDENYTVNFTNYVYAMTGNEWSAILNYEQDQLPEIVDRGVVFARMSGQQKQELVQELQKKGYYVAMCGDGANDCGALKAAHVGISLSEEESSVASPYISKISDITCVPTIIKEGRAALTTSIGAFKYMVCYSLTQFTSTIILYGIDSNLTSNQFLFIDIGLTLHLTSWFGKTKAYGGDLNKKRPPSSLLGFVSLASIISQMFIMIVFQIMSYNLIQTYSWFTPFILDPEKPNFYVSYENYAVYCMSMFQYIVLAVVFSKGKPFRKPIYTNFFFSTSLAIMTITCAYITWIPAEWICEILEFKLPPSDEAAHAILLLALGNFVCSFVFEDLIVGYVLDKRLIPKVRQFLSKKRNCTK